MHDIDDANHEKVLADLREYARRELAGQTELRDPTALELAPRNDGATIHATYADGYRRSRDVGDIDRARQVHALADTAWNRLGNPHSTELSLAPGANGRPTQVRIRTRNPLAREGYDERLCSWDELRSNRKAHDQRRQRPPAPDAT